MAELQQQYEQIQESLHVNTAYLASAEQKQQWQECVDDLRRELWVIDGALNHNLDLDRLT